MIRGATASPGSPGACAAAGFVIAERPSLLDWLFHLPMNILCLNELPPLVEGFNLGGNC